MTAAPIPDHPADQLAELERLRGCLARVRATAFLYAGRPASLDPAKPLAGGFEAFAVIVRTLDQAEAEASANDEPAAEVTRLRAGLARARAVAVIRATPPTVSRAPGLVDVQRNAFATIASAIGAGLDVAANDVVVSLLDRRRAAS